MAREMLIAGFGIAAGARLGHAAGMDFAIVIPNWNGAAFIERCLGSVYAALRVAGYPAAEVIVHDDASTDDSVERIRRSFPQTHLITSQENVGFGAGVGRGMSATSAEWVFLLNNDLALATDFFATLLAARDAQSPSAPLFAIGAQTRDWSTQASNHAGQRAVFRGGLLEQEAFAAETLCPTDFFQAGACLLHRRRFLELGGFAPIFHPGYWEDYDLAWAASRRGWTVLYEPRAVAWHCGKGSFRKRYGGYGVSLLLKRNHLLFNWIHLEPAQLRSHWWHLPLKIWRETSEGDEAGWGRALLAALPRTGEALRLRRQRGMVSPPNFS